MTARLRAVKARALTDSPALRFVLMVGAMSFFALRKGSAVSDQAS